MRTLTRPMFNWGGPVKQGVMHGIREPYKHGTRVGAGLVGDPIFPRTGGRSHHAIQAAALFWPQIARLLGGQAAKKGITSLTQGQLFKKGMQESVKKAAGAGGASNILKGAAPVYTGLKGWAMRDPLVRSALWAKDAIFNPTTAGWGKSALRFATAPSSVGLGLYGGYKYLKGDKADPTVTGVEKPGGYPVGPEAEKARVLSDTERAAFAKSQQDARVKKYLDMMGYDRSKKTAIADALIDASKIVSDRGTLDPKNITQELINPIIQATSKRLDKPDQIREAVGLMMTKAGLEKEMYDAKPGTIMKTAQDLFKSGYAKSMDEAIRMATKEPRGVGEALTTFAISNKGSLKDQDISLVIRDYGYKNNIPVEVYTTEQLTETYGKDVTKHPSALEIIQKENITDDGIYQIGSEVIEIVGGKPQKRI